EAALGAVGGKGGFANIQWRLQRPKQEAASLISQGKGKICNRELKLKIISGSDKRL
ncbi:hypothetical protein scyTo_0004800, partial [Scyliorhinus torazame]|nr:hypothetical protein [Scyliorhinus torazame]